MLLAALVVALTGCSVMKMRISGIVEPGPGAVLIQKVPFYPQEEFQCGPASLAGVLNYWKITDTPSDIAAAVFSASAKGTLTIDMALYAQKKGVDALEYSGSLEDLKSKISDGYPLIVMVDYGFWVYQADHFMVVIGYTDDGVIVNSGKSEKIFIKDEVFLKQWNRAKFWALWIKPK